MSTNVVLAKYMVYPLMGTMRAWKLYSGLSRNESYNKFNEELQKQSNNVYTFFGEPVSVDSIKIEAKKAIPYTFSSYEPYYSKPEFPKCN